MRIIRSIDKYNEVTIIDMDIIGAKAFEISYVHSSAYIHTTQRVVQLNFTNKNGKAIVVRYSRGSLEESKGFLTFAGISDLDFSYYLENRLIYDITNNKAYKNKDILNFKGVWLKRFKMLEKAYTVCFGNELLCNQYIQELKLNYKKSLELKNQEIVNNNIVLRQQFIDNQNEKLLPYKWKYESNNKIKSFERNGINLYIFREQAFEELQDTIRLSLDWHTGYLCTGKEDFKPISVLLIGQYGSFAEVCNLQAKASLPKLKIDGASVTILGGYREAQKLKVLILHHPSSDLISDIKSISKYQIYEIEDTPQEYRHIIINIIKNMDIRLYKNYTSLFGFYRLDLILQGMYEVHNMQLVSYIRDSRLRFN